jgi:iron complex transport system ATP-binding protein
MRRLNRERGLTIVWVLHDLNQAAAYSDEIVLMRAGRIIAHGSPDAMLDPRHLNDTFSVRMLKIAHPQTGAPMCVPAYEGNAAELVGARFDDEALIDFASTSKDLAA